MPLPIPADPRGLTPEFLSELVSELHPGLLVLSCDIADSKRYGDASNAASVSTSAQVKCRVRYGGRTAVALPEQLFVKISFPEIQGSSNPVLDAFFENEVRFYGRLRRELDIETPQSIGGRYDPESTRFALLLEDLTPRSAHINTMMDDDNLDVVRALLDALARLHARFWESPRLAADQSWVQNLVQGSLETLFDDYICAHIVKEVGLEKFKREFAQAVGATAEELYAGTKLLKRHQAKLPRTFLHGDAHFGNTYVLPDGTAGRSSMASSWDG